MSEPTGKLYEWIIQNDEPGCFDIYAIYGDGRILSLVGRETYKHFSGRLIETNPLSIADEELAEICLPEIARLASALTAAQEENKCDACMGRGIPTSHLPCMCGGTGKASDAARYLRE